MERFSREGLKEAMVEAMSHSKWSCFTHLLVEERGHFGSVCARAALGYLDRFNFVTCSPSRSNPLLMWACDGDEVLVRAKPATNPRLDAAAKRVAEAQAAQNTARAALVKAQAELEAAKREGR